MSIGVDGAMHMDDLKVLKAHLKCSKQENKNKNMQINEIEVRGSYVT